jgi:hypothetical protein
MFIHQAPVKEATIQHGKGKGDVAKRVSGRRDAISGPERKTLTTEHG